MAIIRRVLTVLAVVAALSGCSGPPGSKTSPSATAAPTVVITSETVRTTESTILQGLDTAIEGGFRMCMTRTQQGGDALASDCELTKTSSLEARKRLVECFIRADRAPTPAQSIAAIIVCQEQMPH